MVKQPMSVTADRMGDDLVVVRIAGEIGIGALVGDNIRHSGVAGDNALDALLREAVPTPVKLVIVDLTDATYLSSMGIATLIRLKNRIAGDGQFRMAVTGNLVTLLKYGRLDQIFSLFPSVEEAVQG